MNKYKKFLKKLGEDSEPTHISTRTVREIFPELFEPKLEKGKFATITEQPLEQTMEQLSEKYGREVKIVKKVKWNKQKDST